MTTWWKKSLAGQFIVFILAALLMGQTIAFLVSSRQREVAIRQAIEGDFVSRTVALSGVLQTVPNDMRRNVLIASSTGYARFWLSDGLPDPSRWYRTAKANLDLSIMDLITANNTELQAEPSIAGQPADGDESITSWQPFKAVDAIPGAQFVHFADQEGMGIAQRLDDGSWLNAAYYKETPPNLWSTQSMLSIGITAVILSIIGALVANRIARPLRELAVSAEALGRGEETSISPPGSPDDIRQLYEAFDRMQLRLRRFVDDRTRMLAAIGHDLRTPLTTLKLRAEFVQDQDLQQKILATVDEMQSMTEATLSFAKSEATSEPTRAVDLAALIGSLCDDLAELDYNVDFRDSGRISYRCRPDNLKRAVRNLIENALRYAGSAAVSVQIAADAIEIRVDDKGPGIPQTQCEQVFAPFYRLEDSRSRDTGGVGLGLSISRAIARQHGGDIVLSSNNPGLRAALLLPLA